MGKKQRNSKKESSPKKGGKGVPSPKFAAPRVEDYAGKQPVRVVITGAAGQIGYALIPMIANGDMFGPDQPVSLRLLDLPFPAVMTSLGGVKMELEDGSYPLVRDVLCTSDATAAFKDADYACLVGAFPRKQGMERKELMEKNVAIFKTMGETIERCASRNIKVVVVGNPANTNCLICSQFAPSIPKENFTALTRLDHNRALGQVAKTAGVPVSDVQNVIIWGNHSSTQFPDVRHGTVQGKPIVDVCREQKQYLMSGDFIPLIQQRGAAIINSRKASSALSAARAIVDHMHDWVLGTREGEWVSMGVVTDGGVYGIAGGICYSMPVTCRNGRWTIVRNLRLDYESKHRMHVSEEELLQEREVALQVIESIRKPPVRVVVTGAAGQIGYALIPMIASGDMFGTDQPVELRLLDLPFPNVMTSLGGLRMELEDGSYPLVHKVVCTSDPAEAFVDAEYACLLGAFPRKQGMERKELMEKNVAIFKAMGKTIELNASRNIKVVVVGNPANTNCLICAEYAPSIPKKNFTALTRLDHNRALGQVAKCAGVPVNEVKNVIIWGNHSSTQFPDVRHGTVGGRKIVDACSNQKAFLLGTAPDGGVIPIIQQRGAAIITARKASSALSAARAIVDHMHDWVLGTKYREFVSMGVITEGSPYGIANEICYSFPVTCKAGEWEIVPGLPLDQESKMRMKATEVELLEERAVAREITQQGGSVPVVISAPADLAYALLPMLARGDMLGQDQHLEIRLLDSAAEQLRLSSFQMELEDGEYPLVDKVVYTADAEVAYKGAEFAVLAGRGSLEENVRIFKEHGESIEKFASRNIRVVVTGAPANTSCVVCATCAPSIPKSNFTALTRLDQNRALKEVARMAQVPLTEVKNVIIWGGDHSTQYPDVRHGTVAGKPILKALSQHAAFLTTGGLIPFVRDRQAAIVEQRKGGFPFMSTARAIVDHMRDWVLGTRGGEFVSMGVIIEGEEYGLPRDLCVSVPVKCRGEVEIQKLALDHESTTRLRLAEKQLLAEREDAFALLSTLRAPAKVVVTGAAGQIGYALIPMIARGDMFGPRPVELRLLDLPFPAVMTALGGVKMELEDGSYPLVHRVICTSDPEEAFKEADYACLVGAFPRKQGMERKELMEKNVAIFKDMGRTIEKVASRDIKVVVVGNPANTNCLVCAKYAPSIPRENFTALTRLDHNRALGQVAKVAGVPVSDVRNVIIWGNHSSTQFPDVRHGTVKGVPISKACADPEYLLTGDFIPLIQQRGAAIINARKASSALSASRAIVDHMRDWVLGTKKGEFVSMGVMTKNNVYGVENGLCYSLPVTCANGKYTVVTDLPRDSETVRRMKTTEEELVAERNLADEITYTPPVRVVVTGAAGQIGYALLPMIARGDMFGNDQEVELRLLDLPFPAVMTALGGAKMELEDGSYPLVSRVVCTSDPKEAFEDADYACLVGAFPRKQGMERKELMAKNVEIFKTMGENIERYASKNIKVVVVGNPANTNCLICADHAPSVPKENFSALTRLDHNRALGQVAKVADVPVDEVRNVIIWGNHSSTQFPDVRHASIQGKPLLEKVSARAAQDMMKGGFIPLIQQRGAAIIEARKASSALSAARAIVCHMHDWVLGTRRNEWVSMGVITQGSPYGIVNDICYSFPVTCKDGKFEIVTGLEWDDESQKRTKITEDELVQERELARALIEESMPAAAKPDFDVAGEWNTGYSKVTLKSSANGSRFEGKWGDKIFQGRFTSATNFEGELLGVKDLVLSGRIVDKMIRWGNGQQWNRI